jgi:hypothetical protein
VGRERQKEQNDKGTKLTTFQPGEVVYLREMTKGKRGCPKFRVKWKSPFEVLRRLSDLNYCTVLAVLVRDNRLSHLIFHALYSRLHRRYYTRSVTN